MQPILRDRVEEASGARRVSLQEIIARCGIGIAHRIYIAGARRKDCPISTSVWAEARIVGPAWAQAVVDAFGGCVVDTSLFWNDVEIIYSAAIHRDHRAGMSVSQILARHRPDEGVYGNPVSLRFVQRVLGINIQEG